MRSAAELGKTLGVLAALWLVLGAIGWAAGAFPAGRNAPDTTPEGDDLVDLAETDDAGVETSDAAAVEVVEDDAWIDQPDAGRTEALALARVCPAPTTPTWALGDLVGDARAEIVVGCANGIDLLAWPSGSPTPTRIAHAASAQSAALLGAAIGDVDGDGASDLVLALDRGLVLVPRDASGGFGPARALAPSRNAAVALGALDASPGLDLAVVHGADPRAEIWLYRGGPTPQRASTTPAPVDTAALAVIDLDVDGHLDVVAVGAQQIQIAFGDSRASVARTRSLTPGGRGAITLDLDADGALELVIERESGACVLDPAPELADTADCTLLGPDDAHRLGGEARSLRASGGGLVAIRHPDVIAWSATEGTSVLATLATTRFGLHRVARDDGALVLLGSSLDDTGGRGLELARASEGAALTEGENAEGRTDVVDAPLVLAITLPDPDAP